MKSIKNISRFEIKYKLSHSQSNKLYNRISNILIPDSNSKNENGYGNYSIYFEAPGWRYKNEKVEGLALRTKPRLRIYKRLCTKWTSTIS